MRNKHRAAQIPAIDVVAEFRHRSAVFVGEEVIGVHGVVAEIFVDLAMKIARAGLDGHVNVAAGADADIACAVAGDGVELGDGRDSGHHGDAAAAAAVVILAAVNHPDVMLFALTVETDVGAAVYGNGQVEIRQIGRSARRKNRQRGHMPAIDGQFFHLFAGNQIADFTGIGLHFHGFAPPR